MFESSRPPLWTAAEAAMATGGTPTDFFAADSVSIDSRTVKEGDLFIAIEGDTFDGHDYVIQAFERGAAAAVVSKRPANLSAAHPLLMVSNTIDALNALGHFSRKRCKGKIIAVTGSVGKTSVKEALRGALAKQGLTFATQGNLNNHFGVPLSLSQMHAYTDYGIFELGMNHAGEISQLSKLVKPDVAIITNVNAVHLEFFESEEAIADAKAEIFEGLSLDGTAILNRDNRHFQKLETKAKTQGIKHIESFGQDSQSQFCLKIYKPDTIGCTVEALCHNETIRYHLGVSGTHNAQNSLAVLAAVYAVGGNMSEAAKTLGNLSAQPGRGKHSSINFKNGTLTVIDDSYNASPASVSAAISNLSEMQQPSAKRKIAYLGDMLELGDQAPDLHRSLADGITEQTLDKIFTVGSLMQHLFQALPPHLQGKHYANAEEAALDAPNVLQPCDLVLVKGSRGIKMEAIIKQLETAHLPITETT